MIQELSFDEWLEFDAAHPAPTFFARPAWSAALAEVYPGMRPAALRIAAGKSRPLVVPLVQMRGGALRWREYCAFPLGGYTCFMREDGTPASTAECEAALSELARFADAVTLIPWPLADAPHTGKAAEHETAIVDLRDGADAALGRVEGIFRRMAGQAERRGVVCSVSRDADAVERYYALLEASAVRWGIGKPKTPKSLIDALVRHGGPDVEIWFAQAEGRDIAGGVVFYGSEEFFFWSAAMLAEYGRLRPSNALNFALIRAAADRKMKWYNLGSSEGLPGVARFKKEIGAESLGYAELRLERTRFKLYTTVRRSVATARAGS